jgi:SAM-dependent methyltransferase
MVVEVQPEFDTNAQMPSLPEKEKPAQKKNIWPWENPDTFLFRLLRGKHGQVGEKTGRNNPPIRGEFKQLFYLMVAPFHAFNGVLYRRLRAPRHGLVKVQLGPGKFNYLPGWINLEGNLFAKKIDVWVNLNNPLPFHDSTVDVIYSHHVIEHLKDIFYHFREMYRVLKPGGIFRVGGPNGDTALRKFSEGDIAWFYDFPDKRKSLGGRFNNWLFCRDEHLSILTLSYLQEIAGDAGFVDIRQCHPREETSYPDLIDAPVLVLEGTEPTPKDPYHLIVEGRKPLTATPA